MARSVATAIVLSNLVVVMATGLAGGVLPGRAVFLLKKYIIMFANIVVSNIIAIFTHKFKRLNMEHKDLNRLKLVLVENEKDWNLACRTVGSDCCDGI